MTIKKSFVLIGATAMVLGTMACTPTINTRGNLIPDSKLQKVQPNVSTQYDVSNLFGPPTIEAPFEDGRGSTWYYAGHTSERLGIFKNEITERKLVEINFDENGVMTSMNTLDPELAKKVDMINRETPTAGREYTILQQFVGNIGRFNGVGQAKKQPGNN